MRTVPQHIWDLWNAGGPAIGTNGAPHGRVTVEQNWSLHTVAHRSFDQGGWVTIGSGPGEVTTACSDGLTVVYLDNIDGSFTKYTPSSNTYLGLAARPAGSSLVHRAVYDPAGYVWLLHVQGSSIHRYNIQLDTWDAAVTVDPVGYRSRAAVGIFQNNIIIVGGYTATAGSPGATTNRTHLYNVTTGHWTERAAMDVSMAECQGAWFSGAFYVFGGYNGNHATPTYTAIGRKYTLATDRWEPITVPFSLAAGGDPTVLALSDGTILVAGGRGGATPTAEAWLYDTFHDTWTQLPNAPFTNYKTGAVVANKPYVWNDSLGPPSPAARLDLPVIVGAPNGLGDYTRGPVRWFQNAANDQVETEIPNVETIDKSSSIDQDAATLKIQMSNQWHMQNGQVLTGDPELGEPGYFTFSRGESSDSQSRWQQSANAWNEVIVPDALLRTYQGYGGKGKSIAQAEADGNIVLTGTWLVDSVRIGTSGKVEISCRDMGKLLIEQQLYPPLVPANLYPLLYARWGFKNLGNDGTFLNVAAPAQFGDAQVTALMWSGTTSYAGAVPEPDYPDYEGNEPGNGYWLQVNDGRIFNFGNKPNYGQNLSDWATNGAKDLENTATGHGYWSLRHDGTVTPHGDAVWYGNGSAASSPIMAFARNHRGDGYWILHMDGTISAHGSATSHGNYPGVIGSPFWGPTSDIATDITGDPTGDGYWVISSQGHVKAFGSAVSPFSPTGNYGEPAGAVYPPNGLVIGVHSGIFAHPDGGGYWTIDQIGNVHAYEKCYHYGQLAGQAYAAVGGNLPFAHPDFPDYISDLIPTPSGRGYWLLGVSGGVYPFGDAVFYGALNGPYEASIRTNGNYSDYTDIIEELALWAGFWLYPNLDADNMPSVHGNIESTGAFGSDRLDETLFDKQPVISPMTKLKEIVGYIIRVDEEGALHFESPNIFSQGNFDEVGTHIATIPSIDEAVQLTQYAVEYADKSSRSEIIISTTDPTAALNDTITTRFTPSTAGILRGMVKPAMWVNGVFTVKHEQEIMAELISLYMWLAQRQGSVTCMANPAIQINDQVRIWERITSETYIHYVRGISTHMDLVAGTYLDTYTTHWMGDGSLWAVDLGIIPFTFAGTYVHRPLTYRLSTSDLSGTTTDPDATYDGNLATSWHSYGADGQLIGYSLGGGQVEYIEYDVNNTINCVGIYPFGLTDVVGGIAWVSVMVGGVWQGASSIPYFPINPPGDFAGVHAPNIPYVYGSIIANEQPVVFTLPGTYDAQRVRITITGFADWDWGPFRWLGGLREVMVGLQ